MYYGCFYIAMYVCIRMYVCTYVFTFVCSVRVCFNIHLIKRSLARFSLNTGSSAAEMLSCTSSSSLVRSRLLAILTELWFKFTFHWKRLQCMDQIETSYSIHTCTVAVYTVHRKIWRSKILVKNTGKAIGEEKFGK